jgi:hypothetical protein
MGVQWAKCNFTANVAYSYPSDVGSYSDQDKAALKIFGPPIDGGDGSTNSAARPISTSGTLTNAVTSTYTSLTGYTQGEPTPVGLAQYLYESLVSTQYEGSYTLVGQEVSYVQLGIVINLAGGRGEWATMNALVQQIQYDLDNGRVTISFGPCTHLTLQDLMELIRCNRTRVESHHIKERVKGTSGDASETDGAGQTPIDGGGTAPTYGATYPWIADQEDDAASDSEDTPPWDVTVGYGNASFIGTGETPNANPIAKFYIGTGNCGDGFDDSYWSSTDDATAGFLVISGDDTADNDILAMYEQEGSFELSPNAPSFELFDGLHGGAPDGIDHTAIGHIMLDLSNELVELTDDSGSYLKWDLSDSPEFDIYNISTGSSAIFDENSITTTAGGDSGDDATIIFTGSDGASFTLDTGALSGKAAYFQELPTCESGTPMHRIFMCSEPY